MLQILTEKEGSREVKSRLPVFSLAPVCARAMLFWNPRLAPVW